MTELFDDHGVRFEYPSEWETEVTEDGSLTSISAVSPGGLAFLLVTLDSSRPAPRDVLDEAVSALRDEYPQLEAADATEMIGGHTAVGQDVQFISLDLVVSCVLRSFRSPVRTVLILCQWADVELGDPEAALAAARRSFAEADA